MFFCATIQRTKGVPNMRMTGEIKLKLGQKLEPFLRFVYGRTPTGVAMINNPWFLGNIPDRLREYLLLEEEILSINMEGEVEYFEQTDPDGRDSLIFEKDDNDGFVCLWAIMNPKNVSRRLLDTLLLVDGRVLTETMPAELCDIPMLRERAEWVVMRRQKQNMSHRDDKTITEWEPPFPNCESYYEEHTLITF